MLLEEFAKEGFIAEGMVQTGVDVIEKAQKALNKVDDSQPQDFHSNITDTDAGKKNGPDQEDEPKTPENDQKPEMLSDDKMLKAAAYSAMSAESMLEALCESCEKHQVEYNEEKKNKLNEMKDSCKLLREGLYEMLKVETKY